VLVLFTLFITVIDQPHIINLLYGKGALNDVDIYLSVCLSVSSREPMHPWHYCSPCVNRWLMIDVQGLQTVNLWTLKTAIDYPSL